MIGSPEEFARLRLSDDPAEYTRAANEEAPLAVWVAVVARYVELREWVAHNKTVPLVVLELLARDSDPKVRAIVASKRKLSPELQRVLANDRDASVRERLANNRKCSNLVLQVLAADPEPFIQVAAARNLREQNRAA